MADISLGEIFLSLAGRQTCPQHSDAVDLTKRDERGEGERRELGEEEEGRV